MGGDRRCGPFAAHRDSSFIDRIAALRRAGESYGDVILRLTAAERA